MTKIKTAHGFVAGFDFNLGRVAFTKDAVFAKKFEDTEAAAEFAVKHGLEVLAWAVRP